MCCIFGVLYPNEVSADTLKHQIEKMSKISSYRGSDLTSIELFDKAAIGINRLSILSLNEKSGIYAIGTYRSTMNGEIANYCNINKELGLKDGCDSAVILPILMKYGDDFIQKLTGMFAISVYNSNNNSIILYRDRLGIKPIYYYQSKEFFAFASEIKILYSIIDPKPNVDINVINHILKYRFQPGIETVFTSINRVLPGEKIVVNSNGLTRKRYWELKRNQADDVMSYSVEEFSQLFETVIHENSKSDVPGGYFTSGGLDWSLVTSVGLTQKGSYYNKPISIKFFPNSVVDEKYGELLEKYLNTSFEWVHISDNVARDTLEILIPFLDEPLENPTHVGTYLMAKRAKEMGLKSIMTGDGSDEFFLGYERHTCWFKSHDPQKDYPSLGWTMSPNEESELFGDKLFSPIVNGYGKYIEQINNIEDALLFERNERLPEYHNMRLDRITMAHGIEAKVPFLDHRIVEYSLRIPVNVLHGDDGKAWLKIVASKWLPREVIYRPKVLFPSLPNQWIGGPGISWASQILLDGSCRIGDYINSKVVENYLKEHK